MRGFKRLLYEFWADEIGVILSAEAALLGTVAVVGATVGVSALTHSVDEELTEVASAFRSLDQSYHYEGQRGCSAWTAGSSYQQPCVEESLEELHEYIEELEEHQHHSEHGRHHEEGDDDHDRRESEGDDDDRDDRRRESEEDDDDDRQERRRESEDDEDDDRRRDRDDDEEDEDRPQSRDRDDDDDHELSLEESSFDEFSDPIRVRTTASE